MSEPGDDAPLRRGTPAYRGHVWRMLLIGLLPPLTALVGIAALRILDAAQADPDVLGMEVAGFLLLVLVGAGVLGFIATIDRRTRTAGIATVLLALTLNPLTASMGLALVESLS